MAAIREPLTRQPLCAPAATATAGGAGAASELAARRGDPTSYTLPQPMLGLASARMGTVGGVAGMC